MRRPVIDAWFYCVCMCTFLAYVVYSCFLSFLYHSWWINVFIKYRAILSFGSYSSLQATYTLRKLFQHITTLSSHLSPIRQSLMAQIAVDYVITPWRIDVRIKLATNGPTLTADTNGRLKLLFVLRPSLSAINVEPGIAGRVPVKLNLSRVRDAGAFNFRCPVTPRH